MEPLNSAGPTQESAVSLSNIFERNPHSQAQPQRDVVDHVVIDKESPSLPEMKAYLQKHLSTNTMPSHRLGRNTERFSAFGARLELRSLHEQVVARKAKMKQLNQTICYQAGIIQEKDDRIEEQNGVICQLEQVVEWLEDEINKQEDELRGQIRRNKRKVQMQGVWQKVRFLK
jgi:hypothetical protein